MLSESWGHFFPFLYGIPYKSMSLVKLVDSSNCTWFVISDIKNKKEGKDTKGTLKLINWECHGKKTNKCHVI